MLRRTLRHLGPADGPAGWYEVIAICDGDVDGSYVACTELMPIEGWLSLHRAAHRAGAPCVTIGPLLPPLDARLSSYDWQDDAATAGYPLGVAAPRSCGWPRRQRLRASWCCISRSPAYGRPSHRLGGCGRRNRAHPAQPGWLARTLADTLFLPIRPRDTHPRRVVEGGAHEYRAGCRAKDPAAKAPSASLGGAWTLTHCR